MKHPFIFGKIFFGELELNKKWRAVKDKDYWILKRRGNFISVKKIDGYPKTFLIQSGRKFLLGYIEPRNFPILNRDFFRHGDIDNIVNNLKKNPRTEYLIVFLDTDSPTIKIYRDALCAIPIFYLNGENVFSFSNEFTALFPFLSGRNNQSEIDFWGLAEFLLGLESVNRTIFNGIKLLTERAVLIKTNQSLKIKLPRQSFIKLKKTKKSKNPLNDFKRNLEKILKIYWNKIPSKKSVGFEISGGVDSATAPGFYSKLGNQRLFSVNMLLPGKKEKTSQMAKIKDLTDKFRLKNEVFSISSQFPLSSQVKLKKFKPFYHWREIYGEALSGQINLARKRGVRQIFTGMGGDEMFKIDPREEDGSQGVKEVAFRRKLIFPKFFTNKFKRKFFEGLSAKKSVPVPLVPYSVLDANFSRNNLYVEWGIWPISPLADPELVKFCRSLPGKWRRDKKIMREYQKTNDYPESVYQPSFNENFANFFDESLRKNLRKFLLKLYHRSVLDDLRLVKKDILIADYLKFSNGKTCDNSLYFYSIAVIEIIFQSFVKK